MGRQEGTQGVAAGPLLGTHTDTHREVRVACSLSIMPGAIPWFSHHGYLSNLRHFLITSLPIISGRCLVLTASTKYKLRFCCCFFLNFYLFIYYYSFFYLFIFFYFLFL